MLPTALPEALVTVRWQAFAGTMATYNNLTARGRLGKSGAATFYFGTSLISPKLIELESCNLVRWQAFAGTMATYNNLTARGRLEDQQRPLCILGSPLYLCS